MPTYLVQSEATAAVPRFDGVTGVVVAAASEAAARTAAKALFTGDPNILWDNATVTLISGGLQPTTLATNYTPLIAGVDENDIEVNDIEGVAEGQIWRALGLDEFLVVTSVNVGLGVVTFARSQFGSPQQTLEVDMQLELQPLVYVEPPADGTVLALIKQ